MDFMEGLELGRGLEEKKSLKKVLEEGRCVLNVQNVNFGFHTFLVGIQNLITQYEQKHQ